MEYKQLLTPQSAWRREQLTSQLLWRLAEGAGACTYLLGVADDGLPVGLPPDQLAASVDTLSTLAASLGCSTTVSSTHSGTGGPTHAWATVAVARPCVVAPTGAGTPTRVALGGAPGAGKSTLLALLLRGGSCTSLDALDDGAGGARACVAAHKHELVTGRTSALRHHCVAYDACGRPCCVDGSPEAGDVAQRASSLTTLCELPSGEYAKTALFGLTAGWPHAMVICTRAGQPLSVHTAQHLAAALALDIPVAGVLTHVDATPQGSAPADWAVPLRAALRAAAQALAHQQHPCDTDVKDVQSDDSIAPVVSDAQHAQSCAALVMAGMAGSRGGARVVCPLLPLSCVTGVGVGTMHAFLAALRASHGGPWGAQLQQHNAASLLVFTVETLLQNPDAGILAAGVAVCGSARPGEPLWLGPVPPSEESAVASTPLFVRVTVRTVHIAHCAVDALSAGQAASIALVGATAGGVEQLTRLAASPRKGLTLLGCSPDPLVQSPPSTCRSIDIRLAGVVPGWSSASGLVVHCGSCKAQVRLEQLHAGDCDTGADQAACKRLARRAAACAAVLACVDSGTSTPGAAAAPEVMSARLVFTQASQWMLVGAPLLLCDASTAAVLAVGDVMRF